MAKIRFTVNRYGNVVVQLPMNTNFLEQPVFVELKAGYEEKSVVKELWKEYAKGDKLTPFKIRKGVSELALGDM